MDRVKSFVIKLYKSIMDTDVFGLSAQLAYFLLLSLFPFLLFLITLLGYLPIDAYIVIETLANYLPEDVINMIETNLNEVVNSQRGGLLSISIIGTLWSASNGINAITKAFNRAYEVEEDRPFFVARLIAVALTVAMILVIAVALLLPVFGKMIGIYLFSFINLSENFLNIWNTLRWVVSSLVFFIVLIVLYKLAPNSVVKFKHAVWGALFATIGWQLVSLGFSYYVNTLGNYSATYGSLGTVIVLMIWFYISGLIIIIGGMINSIVADFK